MKSVYAPRLLLGIILLFVCQSGAEPYASLPTKGVIPDEATAVGVAQVIFLPVFGKEQTAKFQPYHAQLKGDVWTVYGTLEQGWRGGTPELRIRKSDGKVLEIWHSR